MPSLLLYVSTNTDEVLPWGLFLNIGGHRDAESQLGSACPVTSGQSGQSRTRAAPPAAVRMEVMGSMPVVTLISGQGSAFPVTDLCSFSYRLSVLSHRTVANSFCAVTELTFLASGSAVTHVSIRYFRS